MRSSSIKKIKKEKKKQVIQETRTIQEVSPDHPGGLLGPPRGLPQSENQIVAKDFVDQSQKEPSAKKTEIKLKGPVLLATKSDISALQPHDSVCYALVCKDALFSFEDKIWAS